MRVVAVAVALGEDYERLIKSLRPRVKLRDVIYIILQQPLVDIRFLLTYRMAFHHQQQVMAKSKLNKVQLQDVRSTRSVCMCRWW